MLFSLTGDPAFERMFPEPQKMLANSRLMDRDVIVPERHLGRREIKRLSHAFIVRLQPVGRFFNIFEGGRGLLAAKARHTNSRQHISGNERRGCDGEELAAFIYRDPLDFSNFVRIHS